MTVREFLSHLDVWVYHGTWDQAAEIAALEALGAGVPCVVGEDAAASGLCGPIRCVPPERTRSADEELLSEDRVASDTSHERQEEWQRVLHGLVESARTGQWRRAEART